MQKHMILVTICYSLVELIIPISIECALIIDSPRDFHPIPTLPLIAFGATSISDGIIFMILHPYQPTHVSVLGLNIAFSVVHMDSYKHDPSANTVVIYGTFRVKK